MRYPKDLTGIKFGMMTVIRRTEYKILSNGQRAQCYLCRCDCGQEKVVTRSYLTQRGDKANCGCLADRARNERMIDLTGRRFGKLTVIRRDAKHFTPNGSGRIYWLCRCDCGKEKSVDGSMLRSGKSTSCGCGLVERNQGRLMDLTGQRFGRLSVIARADTRVMLNGQRKTYWLCQCDCGNEKVVSGQALKSGDTLSCGCLNMDKRKERLIDLTGCKFGHLTVICRSENALGRNMKSVPQWLCQCDCGNTLVVKGADLRYGKIKNCGCLGDKKTV